MTTFKNLSRVLQPAELLSSTSPAFLPGQAVHMSSLSPKYITLITPVKGPPTSLGDQHITQIGTDAVALMRRFRISTLSRHLVASRSACPL